MSIQSVVDLPEKEEDPFSIFSTFEDLPVKEEESVSLFKIIEEDFYAKSWVFNEYSFFLKKEYMFLVMINYKMGCFIGEIYAQPEEVFVSSFSDKIKTDMKNYIKAKENSHHKEICIKKCDVDHIVRLYSLLKEGIGEIEYSEFTGYRDFYELFCKFYEKINIDLPESESKSEQ